METTTTKGNEGKHLRSRCLQTHSEKKNDRSCYCCCHGRGTRMLAQQTQVQKNRNEKCRKMMHLHAQICEILSDPITQPIPQIDIKNQEKETQTE